MNTKTKPGIAGGIFLIGLGILIFTGSWWPGIMFVLGLAAGAERAFRGKYIQALIVFAFFSAIPFFSNVGIPWHIFGPFILISIGIIAVVQALTSDRAQG